MIPPDLTNVITHGSKNRGDRIIGGLKMEPYVLPFVFQPGAEQQMPPGWRKH
jgi:hypothetical protein